MAHLTFVAPLVNGTVSPRSFKAGQGPRDYFQTFSAGDELCGNARVERGIGIKDEPGH